METVKYTGISPIMFFISRSNSIYSFLNRVAIFLTAFIVVNVAECAMATTDHIEIVTEEAPPFQTVKDGFVGGAATEIVMAAADAAGLKYTVNVYPWARAYKMATEKPNVCIYSIVKLKERESKFQWAGELADIKCHIYKLKSRKNILLKSIEDAKSFNFVVVRDDLAHHFLAAHGFEKDKNYYLTSDHIHALKMLFAGGGISLIINDNATILYRTRKAGVNYSSMERILEVPELNTKLNVAFSLETPTEIVTSFSQALEQMKTDGSFDAIWQKWGLYPQE